jgi:hypothetical protein
LKKKNSYFKFSFLSYQKKKKIFVLNGSFSNSKIFNRNFTIENFGHIFFFLKKKKICIQILNKKNKGMKKNSYCFFFFSFLIHVNITFYIKSKWEKKNAIRLYAIYFLTWVLLKFCIVKKKRSLNKKKKKFK